MADASPIDTSDDAAELQRKLQEKEQVVAALTERLEQAADQLDRLHRTGADRGPRSGGLPPQLVENQQTLVEELQRAVQQWEDLQTGSTLGRMEVQLDELRDLMLHRFDRLEQGAGLPPATESSSGEPADARPNSRDRQPEDSSDGGTAWDAVKAQLLGESPPDDVDAEAGAAGNAFEAGSLPEDDPSATLSGEAPRLPEPIDVDRADRDDLAVAVLDRDECIDSLLRRLRAADMRLLDTIDWGSLNAAPEELTAELQRLKGQLLDRMRESEVQNSLERARLARDAIRLDQREAELEQRIRQLGLKIPDGEHRPGEAGPEQDSGGRWMRLLGRGRGE